jgi:hypothetical protein
MNDVVEELRVCVCMESKRGWRGDRRVPREEDYVWRRRLRQKYKEIKAHIEGGQGKFVCLGCFWGGGRKVGKEGGRAGR